MKKPTKRAPAKPKAPEVPTVTTHHLKAVPETFDPIASGLRTFDIRLDDRGFKVGHRIKYHRYDERSPEAVGLTCTKTISYVLYGVEEQVTVSRYRWGLRAHYVALGLRD